MNAIMRFMKRNYKVLIIVVALCAALWSFVPKEIYASSEPDPEKDRLLIELLTFVIEKGHYDPATIDDDFSKAVYKNYMEAIDPSKRFFLQSDIDEFAKYQTVIDDQINARDLSFFYLTHERLVQRIGESQKYYKDILSKPFDYTKNETINTDYEKHAYAKNTAELRERWYKQIKLSTLSSLTNKLEIQEGKDVSDNVDDLDEQTFELNKKAEDIKKKLEKEKAEVENKSFEVLEKETRESQMKSLDEFFGFMTELNRDDYFSVYINSIASQFDPHTSYFAPDDKERFDVSMSGKLEGIGARLQKKNDFTEISELISGGPAWRGKELEPGDVVLKVAQGSAEAVDVVGMRLDDVVKKIKGPKGTEVRLTVKKTDGTIKIISIIRDEVEIEETYARSSIVEKNGKKYGIIYLPKFYIDFENKDSRDAAKDIALEVSRMKEAGVHGIVMDVRDNGGGSLKTVVDIAGLFIEKGPIVQIKSAGTKKEILSDKDSRIQYDGPLVVMVNGFSASASEILAAAIQDYRRGVIIGSSQTYGKGTVQNVIDLNQFIRGNSYGNLGALKTTTQKFYRINGGSTQLNGVSSDVALPDRYSYLKMGERDIDNAMKWDKIDPADYKVWDKQNNLDYAIERSKKRMEQNPQFALIEENAQWIKKRQDENDFSLNIDKFRAEQIALEEKAKKYKAISKYNNQLKFSSLPYENELIKNDNLLKEKRDRWHETLSKDVYVEEALNVLDDLQGNSPQKGTVNVKKKDKLVRS
ncbi:tail-specific protease [Flavobacterium sp. NST-5]|uniref:Tail-specific protease n=1 Tax=Flavobacterium ichthyis TaxID=2698827 RepID=A0ABW9Z6S9_9FLAO|nr:carboxy terminal-processing peptidase [Flavobacterium ichthyis]NBL64578.1 tail-specific protease [Flavobacterium ichthyis]